MPDARFFFVCGPPEAGLYKAHIGQNLQYLVDLSIRNTLEGDDPA